jgi:hypothetical protein
VPVLLHQRDVGGFDRYGAARRAHGYANLGLCQSRCVIDAVADHHDDPALPLVRFDDCDLVLGQQVGPIGDPKDIGDRGRGLLIVASQQFDVRHAKSA